MAANRACGRKDAANAAYDAAQDRMRLLPNYYRWIYSTFSRYVAGKVLELGAGAGHLIPFYVDVADHVFALDFHPGLLEAIRNRHEDQRVTVIAADMRDDFGQTLPCCVDTVIALDVLEHFYDDGHLVAVAADTLAPQGHLIVKVPANPRLFGETDRASGHFRRYDPERLREVMAAAGLEEVSLKRFNRLGALGYRRRRDRKVNFSRTFHPAVLKGINLAIPFLTVADRAMWGEGLSLIGVFRKP